MIRILIIEFLLGGVLGAVIFRVTWGFTHNKRTAWALVAILLFLVLVFGTTRLEYPGYWSGPD